MRLADRPDEAMTTADLARQFRIPYNHLTKVVQDLTHGSFVVTQHGAGGGIRLARPANAITLGDVVRFLEQRYAITECFRADCGTCLLTPRCRLKSRLAATHTRLSLQNSTRPPLPRVLFPGRSMATQHQSGVTRRYCGVNPVSISSQDSTTYCSCMRNTRK